MTPVRLDSNKRQAVTTLLVAVLLALSVLAQELAAQEWESSLTAEIRRTGLTVELLRYVYVDVAPVALQAEIARNRSDILSQAGKAAGDLGAAANFDAEVDQQWSWNQLRMPEIVRIPDDYRREQYGYDVASFAADQYREADMTTAAREVTDAMRSGDQARLVSEILAGMVVLVIAAYLVSEIIARRSGSATPPDPDVGLVPRFWAGSTAAAFFAWILLGVIPWAQVHAANDAARAGVESSRAAVRLTATVAAGAHVATFALGSARDAEFAELRVLARQYAEVGAAPGIAQSEQVATAAYQDAVTDQRAITELMTRPLASVVGVDPDLAAIADPDPAGWGGLQQEQADLASSANRRTADANVLSASVLLASLSLTLSTLVAATAVQNRTRFLTATPVVLVLLSAAMCVIASAS